MRPVTDRRDDTGDAPDPDLSADHAAAVAFLATRDRPCPVCSYNLRGVVRAICPECGAALHLQVGSENLRVGPWLLAVVSFALALGFDGVVTVLLTVMAIAHPPRGPADWRMAGTLMGIFILLAGLAGAGLAVVVQRRRSWAFLPRHRQRATAAAIFAAVGITHLVAAAVVMSLLR